MIKKTSSDVFSIMEKKSVMGYVVEVLETSTIVRTQEKINKIKEEILSWPLGVIETGVLQKHLQNILDEEEVILVIFKKIKKNGKIGCRKEFKKGFSYYIGRDPESLSKVYVHWNEEKKFLLKNIECLKSEAFWVEKQIIDLTPNVSFVNIALFNSLEKGVLEGEIFLYIGYK